MKRTHVSCDLPAGVNVILGQNDEETIINGEITPISLVLELPVSEAVTTQKKLRSFVDKLEMGRIAAGDSPPEPAPNPLPPRDFLGGGLTLELIVARLRNLGYDLTCGRCAEIFYTGGTSAPHDPNCQTKA